MIRSCGGSGDQEYNGWGKEIVTQNIFIIVPQSKEGRIQLLGYGVMKEIGVKVRRV